jgi:putative transposase
MSDSPKDANQQPFTNLNKAFTRWFKGMKKGDKRVRHPVFKHKGDRDSFYISNDRFTVEDRVVHLPVIGNVRLREPLRFDGKVMSATVSREADCWFISITVKIPEYHKQRIANGSIGIDLGLKTTVVCSDGQRFSAPKPLKGNLNRLRRLSRQHSRKQKGSNRRRKSQLRLARLHRRISNISKDWLHKVTTKICSENQTICLEDLNVKGMMANHHLARAIADVGWYEFRRQITYKSKIYGDEVGIVGRWSPTTKTCSRCGCKKDFISLSERVFRCCHCGNVIDRDDNAAINIHTAGLAEIYARGQESSGSVLLNETSLVETRTTPEADSRLLTK